MLSLCCSVSHLRSSIVSANCSKFPGTSCRQSLVVVGGMLPLSSLNSSKLSGISCLPSRTVLGSRIGVAVRLFLCPGFNALCCMSVVWKLSKSCGRASFPSLTVLWFLQSLFFKVLQVGSPSFHASVHPFSNMGTCSTPHTIQLERVSYILNF